MRSGRHYLPTPDGVSTTVATVVEQNLRPVVCLDYALEVGQEGAVASPIGVVRAPEPPGDTSLATSLSKKEELAFVAIRAGQVRTPTIRISEPDAIKWLQTHGQSPPWPKLAYMLAEYLTLDEVGEEATRVGEFIR
jgi:hypothetical protein